MTPLSLAELRTDGEEFMEAVAREYYHAYSGLKPSAELQPIYERFARVTGDAALELATDLFRNAAPGTEAHRSAQLLLEWQVESQTTRRLAAHDEKEIAWEASALVRLPDGGAIPYQRLAIEMANATDRPWRLQAEQARSTLVTAELAPLKRERLMIEKDIIESLEVADGYIATFSALSGIDLNGLIAECQGFLRDTQAMWDDVYPERVRRGLGIEPGEATRSDALALLRAREFDRHFPGDSMERTIRDQVREMGIDPEASGRVRFDTGEREGKRSRAFCAPLKVPDEVYLVLRPHGGQSDYSTFLHELGHALHFAYMRPDHPFEFRWLGDNSITEAYAMLFDHLTQDAGWLRRYTELGTPMLPAFLRSAGFEELHFLRRYCAKLIYEAQVYMGLIPWDSLPSLYVDALGDATTFRYDESDAFVDLDPRFYSARYLRAWQLRAVIADTLVSRFDEDWFRNPTAGPWMVEQLFAEAQRELAHEQAQRVSGRQLSFAPLVSSIERLLAS